MALTKERQGEIAFAVLLHMALEEGITLQPKELKRDVGNRARKYGITAVEAAEMAKIAMNEAYTRCVAVLDGIIAHPPTQAELSED